MQRALTHYLAYGQAYMQQISMNTGLYITIELQMKKIWLAAS